MLSNYRGFLLRTLCLAVLTSLLMTAIGQVEAVRHYSHAQGNCELCESGERAIVIHQKLAPGDYVHVVDPACSTDTSSDITQAIQALGRTHIPQLDQYVGPVLGGIGNEATNFVKENIRGTVGGWLSKHTGAAANCAVVAALIPAAGEVTGFRLGAYDAFGESKKCEVNVDCGIGWSKWSMEPVVKKTADTQMAYSVFKNWSDSRERMAVFWVFYKYEGPMVR